MATFLFDKIVFGPVKSRRLGSSLGINLLPVSKKLCNFDCIYCECGWSNIHHIKNDDIPAVEDVIQALLKTLQEMKSKGEKPDVITYAGNGEPTMHPQFSEIAEKVCEVRNEFFPDCKISLLCNSALLFKKEIIESLKFIDQNILKLDTAIENSFQKINRPSGGIKLERIISELSKVKTQKTIQTLFLKGKDELSEIDNTTEKEINALIGAYKKIKPDSIMVYSFYRDTPTSSLITIKENKLREIANRIEKEGFKVELTI
jgi:wyosine [tRNA(Phe)-imidazoG37] synthetase (radical SAM superfamily)